MTTDPIHPVIDRVRVATDAVLERLPRLARGIPAVVANSAALRLLFRLRGASDRTAQLAKKLSLDISALVTQVGGQAEALMAQLMALDSVCLDDVEDPERRAAIRAARKAEVARINDSLTSVDALLARAKRAKALVLRLVSFPAPLPATPAPSPAEPCDVNMDTEKEQGVETERPETETDEEEAGRVVPSPVQVDVAEDEVEEEPAVPMPPPAIAKPVDLRSLFPGQASPVVCPRSHRRHTKPRRKTVHHPSRVPLHRPVPTTAWGFPSGWGMWGW